MTDNTENGNGSENNFLGLRELGEQGGFNFGQLRKALSERRKGVDAYVVFKERIYERGDEDTARQASEFRRINDLDLGPEFSGDSLRAAVVEQGKRRGQVTYAGNNYEYLRFTQINNKPIFLRELKIDGSVMPIVKESPAIDLPKVGIPGFTLKQGENYLGGLIGASKQMQGLYQEIIESAKYGFTVLLRGASGTGKEGAAKALHRLGERKEEPFVSVNCAAIPGQLLESELFGHVAGAFTGATRDREGKFRKANGGTIFLDEIGDMPLAQQAKILRAIEYGAVEPVGSDDQKETDVRVVLATNRDLEEMVGKGEFREDLLMRVQSNEIDLPSLKEREGDIPILAAYFLEIIKEGYGADKVLSDEAREVLETYDWPGNVRELKGVIERAVVTSNSHLEIGREHLPKKIQPKEETATKS